MGRPPHLPRCRRPASARTVHAAVARRWPGAPRACCGRSGRHHPRAPLRPRCRASVTTPQLTRQRMRRGRRRAGRRAARVAAGRAARLSASSARNSSRVGLGSAQAASSSRMPASSDAERLARGPPRTVVGGLQAREGALAFGLGQRLRLRCRRSSRLDAPPPVAAASTIAAAAAVRLAVGASAFRVGLGLDRAQQVGERHGLRAARSSSRRRRSRG